LQSRSLRSLVKSPEHAVMVLRGRLNGQLVTLSLKRGALTVALGDDVVLALDRAGRLWSLFIAGHHFRRGLNGAVLAKWNDHGMRQRRHLWRSEADLVVARAVGIVRQLKADLRLETVLSADEQAAVSGALNETLARAAAFDVAAARDDVERYHQVYKPIGILPPDQYLALVLQVTEGCSFNTCTFCSFYKERPFRIKSPRELRAHIAAVRDYLGDSILLRRGVFLADANALVVPQRQLVALMDVVCEELAGPQDVAAFLDGFSGRKKSATDYAALVERGLRRVYVGLESGHDPLLAWVRKPGSAADAVRAVRQMKQGGAHAGVIVMLGLGGARYADGHVRDTIEVLNQMELSEGDLLYFSAFVPGDTAYETQVDTADLWPLPQPHMQSQREAILAGLRFCGRGPLTATYDIREFIY
jgi:hypothetical protein